jgi:hypothetical protein
MPIGPVQLPGIQIASTLEGHRKALTRARDNDAREASILMEFTTTGEGSTLLPATNFPITFLAMPAMTSGYAITKGPAVLVASRFPVATAGVASYVTDDRDCFIGARMFFVVTTGAARPYELAELQAAYDFAANEYGNGSVAAINAKAKLDEAKALQYELIHFVTFTGPALKLDPGR